MKHAKTLAKLLVCLLALSMLLGTFAACTDKGPKDDVKGTTGTTVEGEIPPPDLEGLNIGRTVKMLGWGTEADGGYDEQYRGNELSDNAVKKEIFVRQQTLESQLNFTFEWKIMAGDWKGRSAMMAEVDAINNKGGGEPYEAVVTYNLNPFMFAYNGLAENMYGHKYLDLSKPWWPQSLTNEILVNETVYGVIENNDYGVLRNIAAMFFNNTLLEKKGLESPYDLVASDNWNMAKLSEMVKNTYEDLNGNSTKDKDIDLFGFCGATGAKRDFWFTALGGNYTEVKDGVIVDRLGDMKEMQEFLDITRAFLNTPDTLDYDSEQYKMFQDERAVFYASTLAITEGITSKELDIDYGVVPPPKRDSEQKEYYTMSHNTHDAWMIPINSPDLDAVCGIIEQSAYLAYKTIGPLYFDTYVKLRYAPDERLAGMYDLVRDSIIFDLSYLFLGSYTNVTSPCQVIRGLISQPSGQTWTDVYSANGELWHAALQDFATIYGADVVKG